MDGGYTFFRSTLDGCRRVGVSRESLEKKYVLFTGPYHMIGGARESLLSEQAREYSYHSPFSTELTEYCITPSKKIDTSRVIEHI